MPISDSADPKSPPANDAEGKQSPAQTSGSLFGTLTNLIGRVLKTERSESFRESIEEVIEESEREVQELSTPERSMLTNILQFGELKISDVMVPRADIIAVEEQTPLPEALALFREAQHSRLPLFRETLDDPIGMVHVKDLLSLLETAPSGDMRWPQTPISKIRREALFVPPSMPALDLLLKMQATRIHLALVIDEYGGTDGLVSIEDLVEEIVGDIDDEHDVGEEHQVVARPDGGFDADARTELEDFKERTGIDLIPKETEEDIDTLGGLVSSILSRVPIRGEIVSFPDGYEFEILEADPRRVKRLRVRRAAQMGMKPRQDGA